jgi:uncharacterized protein YkvS
MRVGNGLQFPAGSSGVISRIQDEYAILDLIHKDKKYVTPIKLQNLKPKD